MPIFRQSSSIKIAWGAAVAQWIRSRLPSCHPGFKSQAHHLRFFHFKFEFKLWRIGKTKIKGKRGRDWTIILKKIANLKVGSWPKISGAYKTGLWVKIIQFYLQSSFCNNLIWFFGHLIKANFWWLEYFLNPFSNTICTFINPSLSCEFYIWEVTDFCFIFVAFNSISIDQIIDESFLER